VEAVHLKYFLKIKSIRRVPSVYPFLPPFPDIFGDGRAKARKSRGDEPLGQETGDVS